MSALTVDTLNGAPLEPPGLYVVDDRDHAAWLDAVAADYTHWGSGKSFLARDAMAPFYDTSLDLRVFEARSSWLDEAQAVVDSAVDQAQLEHIREEAAERLEAMREQISDINDALRVDINRDDLPDIVVPEAALTQGIQPKPLLDSDDDFVDQTMRPIDSKAYLEIGGA